MENRVEAARAALGAREELALGELGDRAVTAARAALSAAGWPEAVGESYAYLVADQALHVGSGLNVAAYAELGTGKYYQPPPEWLENRTPRGGKVRPGQDRWVYLDSESGRFRVGGPVKGGLFLSRAMMGLRETGADVLRAAMEGG